MPSFADKLKELRKQKNLSQKQLSSASGVSQQAISHIETGSHSPTEQTIRMLANALGVQTGYFFNDMTEQQKPAQEKGRQELLSQIDIKFSQLPQDLKMQAMAYVAGRIASRKDQ